MDPLRILLVSRVFWPNLGGIEKHVEWLALHLHRRGHHVSVLTLDRAFEDGRALPPTDQLGPIPITRVPFRGSTRYPLAPSVLRHVAGHDVVHVHAVDFLADWLVATRVLHHTPVVLSTHGGFFHTSFASAAKRLWFQTATRALTRSVDALVYTSDQDEALFRTITPRGRVIRTGVDMARWAGLAPAPVAGRWITVGRVDVHKGIEALLRVLARVRDRDPRPFEARIIGPEVVPGLVGRLTGIRDHLALGDRVRFEGRLSDEALLDAVRTAQLGLWPAEYESFGISVVEAMAAGVYPVLNDIRAFRYFHAPGAGEIVDYRDTEAAATVVLRARDHAEAVAPVRAVAARYAWEEVVGQLEEVYRGVIAARRSGRVG